MKPEAQRAAIAEACGWTSRIVDVDHTDGYFWTEKRITWKLPSGQHAALPNFLADLNAMHEALKILPGSQWQEFEGHLWNATAGQPEGGRRLITATAAQRAEAFLRTLGKWVES